jgi:hypothetical protein
VAVPRKLVLAVVDSLNPDMLDQAIAEERAPVLAALRERGHYVRDCVSTFPSVTPVASAAIATGTGPAGHGVPSMNWYHRGEERYVEYGSSFPATRAFGVVRSLYDTVYNLNLAHLSRALRTVFEHLDDAGLRTACTTYLIYRGRTRHNPARDSVFQRIAEAAAFRHAVWGARELFYADLFDTRGTACSSLLGLPGQRDQHAACVGAHLVENDLFDFLLFSLPDNDTYSHRYGPALQPDSIARADQALERIVEAAGGLESFLSEYAVIVMSDHSQSPVEDRVNLAEVLGDRRVLAPVDAVPDEAELAVCPAARAAMVYVLDERERARLLPEVVADLRSTEGVDLVIQRDRREAVVWSERGELRFRPARRLRDLRGGRWWVRGAREALQLEVAGGIVQSERYPDALGRLWSALSCPDVGDVLVSAAPGYEFVDWGGSDHVGGGSHGSLLAEDSHAVLLMCGVEPEPREQWSVADATPLALRHFSLSS